jgi:argininosuccinate lyase
VDRASVEMIGKKVSAMGLTKQMLADAKDPVKNIERRKIIGGPAKATVRSKIAAEQKKLEADCRQRSALLGQLDRSREALAKAESAIARNRK